MQQSNDSLKGLDYMIQLRDKLCKSSAEAVAMDKAIARYQDALAQLELREALIYTAPKDFHPLFVEELEAEKKLRKDNNKIASWGQYILIGIYAIICFSLLFDKVLF